VRAESDRQRRPRGGGEHDADINVTPLVDVMARAADHLHDHGAAHDDRHDRRVAAHAGSPLPSTEKQMVISITADGKYYIAEHEIRSPSSAPSSRESWKRNPDQEVLDR
jgi:biopolymer transport protein ExbD